MSEELNNDFDALDILICCNSFSTFTGSEMSNYEMAKQLSIWGHNVTVISNIIGDPLKSRAESYGVRVLSVKNLPNEKFDILHINHKPIGEVILKKYRNTPAVMHVRSEVIPVFEVPIISPQIKKYISIRESVKEYIKSFGITEDMITHIDNPFDYNKFNTNYKPVKNEKMVNLFVGTIDHLRINMINDMIRKTKDKNQELWIIGLDRLGVINKLILNNHVKYLGVIDNVEDYYKMCDVTIGIFSGRSTIEGWLCGKPAYIYKVDNNGNIFDISYHEVPEDVSKYRSDKSIELVENLYYDVLNID